MKIGIECSTANGLSLQARPNSLVNWDDTGEFLLPIEKWLSLPVHKKSACHLAGGLNKLYFIKYTANSWIK